MRDNLKARGKLELKIYKNGALIEEFVGENLVIDLGLINIAKLLGGNAAGHPITKVGIGTNPNGPFAADTVLATPTYLAFTSIAYPATGDVEFNFLVGTGDCNGMDIREFGLLTAANVLIARKTRGPLAKDNTISFTGKWTISF